MKTTLFTFLFFALLSPLFAQEVMTIRHSCNFYGEETDEDKYIFPANAEAKRIIDEILKHSGLSAKFEIKESNCSNALAALEGKQRFILYNPLFLQQFKQDANTKWAAYCVLAHEIAHHLNGHDLEETDSKKRRAFELEADKYAGFLLFHLGASLEEAQMGIQTIKLEGATNTHPPKTARLVAIANGWTQASDLRGGEQPAPSNAATTPSRPDHMVLIRGGNFQMGSNDGEADEKPIHSVTVGDFYLSKYELTVAEFRAFIEASGYRTDAEKEGTSKAAEDGKWVDKAGRNWRHDPEGKTADDKHPVINVSWNDAIEYCKWLSQKTGKTYRLPTEAEWEYAAGNGSKHTKYSWGNGNPAGKNGGNVTDESKRPGDGASWGTKFDGYNDGYWYTAPIGSYNPNDFGLYDMTGNVNEWCSDWYGADYYQNSPSSNPIGPTSGSDRVIRGGSWGDVPQDCRVANRYSGTPADRYSNLGFRLARTK